jgi:LuxR family maltose regulon positive regulatory protein
MSLPILQTKLFIPRPRPNLVPRTALLARLTAADLLPITLISAPAGFGKTTLVCEWINAARNNSDTAGELSGGEKEIGFAWQQSGNACMMPALVGIVC